MFERDQLKNIWNLFFFWKCFKYYELKFVFLLVFNLLSSHTYSQRWDDPKKNLAYGSWAKKFFPKIGSWNHELAHEPSHDPINILYKKKFIWKKKLSEKINNNIHTKTTFVNLYKNIIIFVNTFVK